MIFTTSEALVPKRLKKRQTNKNLPQQNDDDDDDDDDDKHSFYYLMMTKATTQAMLQLMYILTIKYPLKRKLIKTQFCPYFLPVR